MPPEDEWARLPQSKEWLYATGDFRGTEHEKECDHVLGWVKGEADCKASLCEHGRDLAKDWLARCEKYGTKSATDEVKELASKLGDKAGEKPSDCATQFDTILRDGCGADATCEKTSQRWATRCGKAEGTPLLLKSLERAVERKLEQPAGITLDTHTCPELAKDLFDAAKCKDQFACQDAIARVTVYRERCESAEERPTIAVAALELGISAAAALKTEPIGVQQGSPNVASGDVPVGLGDGSGAIVMVCEQRIASFDAYLEARKGCQSGRIVMARAFKGAKGPEVRVGTFDFPSDAVFAARFPTLVAFGELEAREKEAKQSLDADLAKIAGLAKSNVGDAVKALAVSLSTNAGWLKRGKSLRVALSSHDADLAPVVAEIGKRKAAALKGRVSAADTQGLVTRATDQLLADVALDGSIQIGATTPASTLRLGAALPTSLAALNTALKPAFALAKSRKLDKKAQTAAKTTASDQARACGAAEKKLQDAKGSLVSCAFGLETCDEAKLETLAKQLDDGRAEAEASFAAATRAVQSQGAGADDPIGSSGCREPWW
jgi:hypothetical protein